MHSLILKLRPLGSLFMNCLVAHLGTVFESIGLTVEQQELVHGNMSINNL